ncbi:MAG: hypothetical protein AB1428_08695 [Bacteroidota bacterium]
MNIRLPLSLLCLLVLSLPAYGQLNTVFGTIFNEILDVRLRRSGSPGQHGSHFLQAAERANRDLVPALNGLVSGNVSSFPLSSTGAGVLFDFSTGVPVRVAESTGPIFAETAKPLGKGKFMIEANYTYLDLVRFRGVPTDQMRFTFAHQDVTGEGELGENPNESDLMDLLMDLHTRAGIGAVVATMGVTNDLDVSVAIPLITVRMSGTATAVINSFTFARLGHANHMFGSDTLNPVLTTQVPYDQSATGLGDVALRVKYSFVRGSDVDLAALVEARFPTGKKEEFLGSGKATLRVWGIMSRRFGDVTPHLNVAYSRKEASYQSDAIEFRAGLDNKLFSDLTLALDVLGQFDLNKDEAVHLAPGSVTITDRVPGGLSVRNVPLSNIPDRTNDNALTASIGLRLSPSDRFMIFGNVLVPLNDGGLRAMVTPTLGLSFYF